MENDKLIQGVIDLGHKVLPQLSTHYSLTIAALNCTHTLLRSKNRMVPDGDLWGGGQVNEGSIVLRIETITRVVRIARVVYTLDCFCTLSVLLMTSFGWFPC